jgi:DNA glycosylase AlkZ-like
VPGERRRLIGWIEEQGIARDGAAWLRDAMTATMRALHDNGELSGAELSKLVPQLREKLRFGENKKWGAEVGMTTRVVFLLAAEGTIVRGRPRGTWISGQYRWAPTDSWLGEPLAEVPAGEASVELLRRWLYAFGPATTTDMRWWMGWTQTKLRTAMEGVDVEEVRLDDGSPAYVLADDVAKVSTRKRWVALLPGLDPTTMGWKERDWYLGSHTPRLFDRNGNAGPTVWADGRVVGAWAQTPDGEIRTHLFTDVSRQQAAAIDQRVAEVAAMIGDTRFTVRFPSPASTALAKGTLPPV